MTGIAFSESRVIFVKRIHRIQHTLMLIKKKCNFDPNEQKTKVKGGCWFVRVFRGTYTALQKHV